MTYSDITSQIIADHRIIINATPVGMFPDENQCPPLPYKYLTSKHLLYDLIYNPEETLFLKKGQRSRRAGEERAGDALFAGGNELGVWNS